MLAAKLNLAGKSGIILEGSPRLGSKLLMSGGGHCNITHGGSIKDFLIAYGDAGPSLRKCLYKHSNFEFACWLTSLGISLADESGAAIDVSEGASALNGIGRIFPSSMKASDVLDAFRSKAIQNGWQIETNQKVCSLSPDDSGTIQDHEHSSLWNIETEKSASITACNAVIATGGITYPKTGSDGSMFALLEDLGVKVIKPRPALAPVYVKEYPYEDLAGISIPDVSVRTFSDDAACSCKGSSSRMRGDLLFTHKGFSGPVILNISKYAVPGQKIRIGYNKDFSDLPRRMQRILEERAKGPSGDIRTTRLASLLDSDDFTVSGIDEYGMVTAGGVALSDLDLSTMTIRFEKSPDSASPAADSLYVIGEAIDADGITGGYNLQLCYSTASLCADSLSSRF